MTIAVYGVQFFDDRTPLTTRPVVSPDVRIDQLVAAATDDAMTFDQQRIVTTAHR